MPRRRPPSAPLRIIVILAFASAATALDFASAQSETTRRDESWPNWRGAGHDGLVQAGGLPKTWRADAPTPLWKAPLAEGWSSPVAAEGKVFATDREGASERVRAFNAADGELVWERTNPVDFEPHDVGRRHGNGPKATPVYDAGRIYTLGIAGWLQCLNARDGTVIWRVHLPAEFGERLPLPENRAYVDGDDRVIVPVGSDVGAPVPLFGYTGSPLIVDHLLITSVGGARGGTIMAFDGLTGAVVWKALDENVSYSSPIVAAPAGRRQIIVATGPRLVGLNIADGKLLWSVPYQNDHDETIGTPAVAGDHVLLTAVGRPLSAWRIKTSGDEVSSVEVWQNHDMSSYLSSVIVVGEHVYGMNDGGEWNCTNLHDGQLRWRGGNFGYYSTPIATSDQIVGLNEQGKLVVFAADPHGYRELAAYKLVDGPSWTSPAAVGNRLYIRSRSGLACYEFK